MKYAKYLGIASIAVGVLTVIFSFAGFFFLPFALFSAIAGFILSSLYISVATRNNLTHAVVNPAYIGLLLNSTPLILFLIGPLLK